MSEVSAGAAETTGWVMTTEGGRSAGTGVDAASRMLTLLETTPSVTSVAVERGRLRRSSKSVLIGASIWADSSLRVLLRRNQSMTALALPDGGTDDDEPCQFASRSAENRFDPVAEEAPSDSFCVRPWRTQAGDAWTCCSASCGFGRGGGMPSCVLDDPATVLERSREAMTDAASTFARACFGSFELTLWRNGCSESAFCRRVDLRRFVTSSSGESFAGTGGTRPDFSLVWFAPPRKERSEKRSAEGAWRWRLEAAEGGLGGCEAWLLVLVFGCEAFAASSATVGG